MLGTCRTCGAQLRRGSMGRPVCKMPRDLGGALNWLAVHSARERYIASRKPKRRR